MDAGTSSDHASVILTFTAAQLFCITSVLNSHICWMKRIKGTKQKRRSPLVCQLLVYAEDLHTNTGDKCLSERLEAQAGF